MHQAGKLSPLRKTGTVFTFRVQAVSHSLGWYPRQWQPVTHVSLWTQPASLLYRFRKRRPIGTRQALVNVSDAERLVRLKLIPVGGAGIIIAAPVSMSMLNRYANRACE